MFERIDGKTMHISARISHFLISEVSKLLLSVAAISIFLTTLAIASPPARAAHRGQDFVIKHATQANRIYLGAGRSIEALITPCPDEWRVGDKLKLGFSDENGIMVTDLRTRDRASVIGLTSIVNPIDAALKSCLSHGKETTIRDEGCYETAADAWRSQLHVALKLGQAVLPKLIMENFAQNHTTLKGVNIASLTSTQRQFAQAVENFVLQGETVNRNLSFVGGTGWSVSGNATDAAFYARVNGILWAQLRLGAAYGGLQDESCRSPKHGSEHPH